MPNIEQGLNRAIRAMSVGSVDSAIDALREVLTNDPDSATAHALLAVCLIDKRRLHAARIEADLALTLAPASITARSTRARIFLAERKFQEAITLVDSLLAEDPTGVDLYLLRASAYSFLGKRSEQNADLRRALELEPDNPDILADLAQMEIQGGSQQAAGDYALSALRSAPEHHGALVTMGTLALHRGDPQTARETAFHALSQDPQSPSALRLVAAIKARESFWLGLWWRYNAWTERVGQTRSIIVLIAAFVAYRIATLLANDLGSPTTALIINVVWIGIVVYSFVGPSVFQRALRKELESVRLKPF